MNDYIECWFLYFSVQFFCINQRAGSCQAREITKICHADILHDFSRL